MRYEKLKRFSMVYGLVFIITAVFTAVITPLVVKIAKRLGVLDIPGAARKIHQKPMPLLGGLAPWFGFCLVVGVIVFWFPELFTAAVPIKHLIGVVIGGTVLMIGGALDDRYRLRPIQQIIFPIIAALMVVASGIGVHEITNPFGGVIQLVRWEWVLFFWQGIPYHFSFPADLFTFAWLLGMMYTTKFLDGLDGLVAGLTAIGCIIIVFLTTTTQWYQPEVGVLAAIAAGAFAGFLVWNFHPAKIFLGEGGSTFAGFLLGTLAIISGGKIATALLVFGLPILDIAWIILRRIFWEHRSAAQDDRKHLHFRLLDLGLSQRGAVLVFYVLATVFGITTLVLQSREKLVAFGILVVLMIIGGSALVVAHKSRNSANK